MFKLFRFRLFLRFVSPSHPSSLGYTQYVKKCVSCFSHDRTRFPKQRRYVRRDICFACESRTALFGGNVSVAARSIIDARARRMQLSDATASFPFCLSRKLTFAGKLHVTAAVGGISSRCAPRFVTLTFSRMHVERTYL